MGFDARCCCLTSAGYAPLTRHELPGHLATQQKFPLDSVDCIDWATRTKVPFGDFASSKKGVMHSVVLAMQTGQPDRC